MKRDKLISVYVTPEIKTRIETLGRVTSRSSAASLAIERYLEGVELAGARIPNHDVDALLGEKLQAAGQWNTATYPRVLADDLDRWGYAELAAAVRAGGYLAACAVIDSALVAVGKRDAPATKEELDTDAQQHKPNGEQP